jgi:hypothetical protein
MKFTEAMSAAETGFAVWATKPHNKKWAKRLDGTPIPNDLLVCIAEEFVRRSDRFIIRA